MRHWLAVALAAALSPNLTVAQESPNHLYDRVQLDGSGALLVLGATLRVDGENGQGTELSVENDLGLSRTTFQPHIAARWRPGRRHEIEAGFQWATRSSETVLTDTILFHDQEFPAGLRVESSIGTNQAFLTYRFAFMAKEKTQVGVGLGLGAILLRSEISAVAGTTTGGPDTAIARYSRESNFNGPTVSLGLYGRFRLGDQWYLNSDLRGIFVKVSNFKAGIVEAGASGRYFLSRTVGVELGYSLGFYAVELERESTGSGFAGIDLTGKFHYTVNNVRAGVVVTF